MAEIIVDIKEDGALIVRHIFYGKTEQDAEKVLDAHLDSDNFLRGALVHEKYKSIPLTFSVKYGKEKD